jgi:predicted nucleic acid-binding protein
MIVLDASVLAPAVGDDGPDGRIARQVLEELAEALDVELVTTNRRLARAPGILCAVRVVPR